MIHKISMREYRKNLKHYMALAKAGEVIEIQKHGETFITIGGESRKIYRIPNVQGFDRNGNPVDTRRPD